ncbi:MAG: hypothetical protein WAV21_00505 [Minisyncoccia bacterium]
MPSFLSTRPFQVIIIAIFGILALAGLYAFTTYTGLGGNSNAVGTVTIWGTLPKNAMETAIGNLKQAQQEYKNVSYVEKAADTFDVDLADAIASGVGPDLVVITQESLTSNEAKLEIVPWSSIPQRTYLDTYVAEYQLFLTSSGSYGIPFVIDPLILFYNRSMLSSVGVAKPPSTWEAVTGLVPSITQVAGGQNIVKSTIPFGSYANVTNARAIVSLLFLQAGSSITETTVQGVRSTLESAAAPGSTTGAAAPVAAMNFYTQFADAAKTVYSWNPSLPTSRQTFIAGDLALYPGFASELSSLRAANPNLDFDIAPIPQPATASKRTTYGVAYAFAIPKASKNKNGAYQASIALSGNAVLPGLATSLGMVPSVRSLLKSDPSDPYAGVYYPEALSASGWLSPAPSVTNGIFAGIIQNITSGRMDTSQALSAAARTLNAAFK